MQEKVDTFKEFLEKKKEKNLVADPEFRKNEWIKAVKNLHKKIGNRLNDYQKKGLIKIHTRNIKRYEEDLGEYEIYQLELIFSGFEKIIFEPRGTILVESKGRIDVKGPKGEMMLILSDDDTWIWAKRTYKLETFDFNEDTFKDVIQQLA